MTGSYLHVHVILSMRANSSAVTLPLPCTSPRLQLAIIMQMLWIEIGLPFYSGQRKLSCNNVIPVRNAALLQQLNFKAKTPLTSGKWGCPKLPLMCMTALKALFPIGKAVSVFFSELGLTKGGLSQFINPCIVKDTAVQRTGNCSHTLTISVHISVFVYFVGSGGG